MKHKILGLLAVGLFAVASTANAIPLRLDATSVGASGFSSFFVIFEDTGDELLQLEEATQFSGTIDPLDGTLYDLLFGVPNIADMAYRTSQTYRPRVVVLLATMFGASWHRNSVYSWHLPRMNLLM